MLFDGILQNSLSDRVGHWYNNDAKGVATLR